MKGLTDVARPLPAPCHGPCPETVTPALAPCLAQTTLASPSLSGTPARSRAAPCPPHTPLHSPVPLPFTSSPAPRPPALNPQAALPSAPFQTGFFCSAYVYDLYSYCSFISSLFSFSCIVFLLYEYITIYVHTTNDNHLIFFQLFSIMNKIAFQPNFTLLILNIILCVVEVH